MTEHIATPKSRPN